MISNEGKVKRHVSKQVHRRADDLESQKAVRLLRRASITAIPYCTVSVNSAGLATPLTVVLTVTDPEVEEVV